MRKTNWQSLYSIAQLFCSCFFIFLNLPVILRLLVVPVKTSKHAIILTFQFLLGLEENSISLINFESC